MDINWSFKLLEPVASIKQVSLRENNSFWMEQRKHIFYGYTTVKPIKAVVWGQKITLSLRVSPYTTSIEKMPIAPIPPPQPKRSQLREERQKLLDELQEKLTSLQATVPPPLADESIYWNYVNAEIFATTFQQLVLTWNNREMEIIEKFPIIAPLLVTIYNGVKDLELPDELMRDDTQFSLGLARILQYVQIIEENATIHHQQLPPEVHELGVFLDSFTDRMIEGGYKIFGVPPKCSEAEHDKFADKRFTAQYSSTLTTDQRLNMLSELLYDPCADTDDQIGFLETAIKLIWDEVSKKPKKPACPHQELIERHLAEIGKELKALEEDQKVWQLRMANELIEAANQWRESGEMPLLTENEFAELIYLKELDIESTQMEDGTISYEIQLYFKDKENSLDGHTMYAKIKNKKVREITLMG